MEYTLCSTEKIIKRCYENHIAERLYSGKKKINKKKKPKKEIIIPSF